MRIVCKLLKKNGYGSLAVLFTELDALKLTDKWIPFCSPFYSTSQVLTDEFVSLTPVLASAHT